MAPTQPAKQSFFGALIFAIIIILTEIIGLTKTSKFIFLFLTGASFIFVYPGTIWINKRCFTWLDNKFRENAIYLRFGLFLFLTLISLLFSYLIFQPDNIVYKIIMGVVVVSPFYLPERVLK